MPREKHGRYDERRGLPDNSMQPIGSGINVWLQEQILEFLGNEEGHVLIAQAAAHKEKRYDWLCARMAERGYPALVEEYQRKQKEDAAERRIRDKRRDLRQWQARLAEASNEMQKAWYQRQIAKCEKYFADREDRSQMSDK